MEEYEQPVVAGKILLFIIRIKRCNLKKQSVLMSKNKNSNMNKLLFGSLYFTNHL